jgi:competence protein ComEA
VSVTDWYTAIVPEDPARRKKLIIAASVGVGFVAIAGALLSSDAGAAPDASVQPDTSVMTDLSDQTVFVQVAGEVKKPGVYELPYDSRVFDAVAAAGGLSDDANPASVNLARIVEDGEQIVVSDSQGGVPAGIIAKININRASATEFDSLPRIGPTIAERIVTFRDANGPFGSIDELGNVPGIGDTTLAGIRDQLTL